MLRVDSPKEISGVRPQNPLHGIVSGAATSTSIVRARSDAATSRPMKLAPITTARRASRHLATIRAAVGERAQINAHAGDRCRECRAAPVRHQVARRSASYANSLASVSRSFTVRGVDCGNAGREPEIKSHAPCKIRRSQWNPVRFRCACEKNPWRGSGDRRERCSSAPAAYATGKPSFRSVSAAALPAAPRPHDDAPRHVLRGTRGVAP